MDPSLEAKLCTRSFVVDAPCCMEKYEIASLKADKTKKNKLGVNFRYQVQWRGVKMVIYKMPVYKFALKSFEITLFLRAFLPSSFIVALLNFIYTLL